jgi:hypothetical protein
MPRVLTSHRVHDVDPGVALIGAQHAPNASTPRLSYRWTRSRSLPPVYPVAFAVAYLLSVYANQAAFLSDLARPTIVVVAAVLIFQIAVTLLLRDHDRGALVTAILVAFVPSEPVPLVVLLALAAFLTVPRRLALMRGRDARNAPWQAITGLLNLVAIIVLTLSVIGLAADGRLIAPATVTSPMLAAAPDAPDIFVILLDGHPRWDTLETKFGYDSEPFLESMRSLGFEVAEKSRSNYNLTELTLASMFQMRHLGGLPELEGADPAESHARKNTLILADLIARAPAFDVLHEHGYEIVGIPSEFSWAAIPADRSLDTGQITDLEIALMTEGRLRVVASDLIRGFVAGQHRDRIVSSLQQVTALAGTAADHPRFVFAHILSPHNPPVFGPQGTNRDGWSCFPTVCTFWVLGEPIGHDAAVEALRDQVAAVDVLVRETATSVVSDDSRPAVVIVMSDHGDRNNLSDKTALLRSIFLSRTPGHPGLFPSDASPVGVLPRLMNAYLGTSIPVAANESYWTDLRSDTGPGLFDPVPIDPDKPSP